jgi:hypothetical protein
LARNADLMRIGRQRRPTAGGVKRAANTWLK